MEINPRMSCSNLFLSYARSATVGITVIKKFVVLLTGMRCMRSETGNIIILYSIYMLFSGCATWIKNICRQLRSALRIWTDMYVINNEC